ncbi:MAG: hypothetical protein L3J33_06275 [Rhodobacteraceae bacterium]|nr:hypothetical protein [Paracoccaceae bacterium]
MTEQTVKKRQVFYLPGYDPMPARRYREMYRREGVAQAKISGYDLSISAKPDKNGPYSWQVKTDMDGLKTHTNIEFLLWNDIVQKSMQASIPMTFWLMLRTLWLYLHTGALFALIRLRPAPMIAALYPVGVLLGQLLLAVLLGWVTVELVGVVFKPLGWAIGLLVAYFVMVTFKKYDPRIYAYYLLYDYAYSAWNAGGHPAELRKRLASFKARIADALASDNDEVLVVGHSSGAHLAIELLAEMERKGNIKSDETRLALLTLGQVVPMVSYLPAAKTLRRNLHDLAQSKTLTWVDFSAPGDGACFALCDPVACSGVAPADQTGPKVLSAAFSKTLSAAQFKKQKNQFFRQHFQYLCAFDNPGIYDYFAITAGPKRLSVRYEGKSASPSMQTRCTSFYKDMSDA